MYAIYIYIYVYSIYIHIHIYSIYICINISTYIYLHICRVNPNLRSAVVPRSVSVLAE